MKTMLAAIKHNHSGKTFFIPVQVDNEGEIFTADVVPVNQQEDEEVYLADEQKAAVWFETEAEKQLLNDQENFPSTNK